MNDSRYYQKKRKLEKEEQYKKYPHKKETYLDTYTKRILIFLGVSFLVVLAYVCLIVVTRG